MRVLRTVVWALVILWAFSCQAADSDLTKVVATVNGSEIRLMELRLEIQQIVPMEASFHGGMSQEKYQKIASRALGQLIDRELQAQDARNKGIKVDDALIKAQIKGLIAQKLWDMNELYAITNEADDEVQKAVQVIQDNSLFDKLNIDR